MDAVYKRKHALASKMMGKAHLEPVTRSDKKMAKRHLEHREELDEDKEKLMKKSMKYNEAHMKEHEKALKKVKKEYEKD